MTSVSVWKWMHVNQPVVHADAQRIAIIIVGDPVLGITEQRPHALVNQPCIDNQITRRRSVRTCPGPDVAEHPSMQRAHEGFLEDLLDRRASAPPPRDGLHHVPLLCRIEVAARSDVSEAQPHEIVRVERCLPITDGNKLAHRFSLATGATKSSPSPPSPRRATHPMRRRLSDPRPSWCVAHDRDHVRPRSAPGDPRSHRANQSGRMRKPTGSPSPPRRDAGNQGGFAHRVRSARAVRLPDPIRRDDARARSVA